jgi:hypothetical protein
MTAAKCSGAAAAVLVTAAAFALYSATLLPGFDFGDTGSFQTTVGSAVIEARKAYPLYFTIGRAMVWATRGDPAHALNLASALEGAIACGLFVLVGAELSGSIVAGAGAALLFAASYTFWSQAIIAEVYALHAVFIGLTLLLLLRWQRQPTLPRLSLFFAFYALGFGNHLSMILLAPAYTLFLLRAAPNGWRSMFSPSIIGVALACAAAGALQYAGMLRGLWLAPQPPHGIVDALQTFWFDVTKSDWRDTTVLTVPQSMIGDRAAMYGFDLRQQFGVAGAVLAVFGALQLMAVDRSRAAMMILLYAVNVVFAYSYNVGDSHVFYLPSHAILALLSGCGVMFASRFVPRAAPVLSAALIVYAALRAYIDKPALDRSHDLRPTQTIAALTDGIDERHNLLLVDVSWQIGNGLSYFAKVLRPSVLYAWMPDVLLYAPTLQLDNAAIDRRFVASARAADDLRRTYGPLFTIRPEPLTAAAISLDEFARTIPPGTKYVLCVLKPTREYTLNQDDIRMALQTLNGEPLELPGGDYAVVAGITGQRALLALGSDHPFARRANIGGVPVTIRMDSWLAADTIRRMGFAHVSAARQPTLIAERGVSIATFGDDGSAIQTRYYANQFAGERRYLIDIASAVP